MIKVIDDGQRATVWYGDLEDGNTFLYNELLFIKFDERWAINLSDGGEHWEMPIDRQVIPVDVEIKVIRN